MCVCDDGADDDDNDGENNTPHHPRSQNNTHTHTLTWTTKKNKTRAHILHAFAVISVRIFSRGPNAKQPDHKHHMAWLACCANMRLFFVSSEKMCSNMLPVCVCVCSSKRFETELMIDIIMFFFRVCVCVCALHRLLLCRVRVFGGCLCGEG